MNVNIKPLSLLPPKLQNTKKPHTKVQFGILKQVQYKFWCFGVLVACIISLSSCNTSNKYSKETRMLDSLRVLVQRADSSMKIIDSAKLTKASEHIMIDLQLLKMYKIDTMSNQSADIFRNYSSIRWALSTVAGRKGPLLTELEKSQEQLSHLNHDLRKGIIKEDSVQIYVGFETKKAGELIEVSNKSISDVKINLPMYDMITPHADSLIALVKENKKI